MKLLENFSTLHKGIGAQQRACTMGEIAEILGCSSRNCRILLKKMEVAEWLVWTAGGGRGHRSFLQFLVTPTQLKLDNLSSLLIKGELGLAFSELDPQEQHALVARLPRFMANRPDESSTLRIPIFRQVESLDPINVFLRTESHLVRQIFSRLTEFDYAAQQLVGGLAHYWESNADATVWHFWCRPDIQFHDGSELTIETIRASLLRVRDADGISRPLFSHLESIEISGTNKIICHLSRADFLWPYCLSTANASIVPIDRDANFGYWPIGSGAFMVSRHNDQQLTLRAFREYYSKRALLNEIDLWLISDKTHTDFDIAFDRQIFTTSLVERSAVFSSGCTYLISNSYRRPFENQKTRLALANLFSGDSIVEFNDLDRLPAQGLLPRWKHTCSNLQDAAKPPGIKSGTSLTLVHGPRPECFLLAEKIRARLLRAGVELKIVPVNDVQSMTREWATWADLYLGSEVIGEDEDFGCVEWLSWDSNFRHWMSKSAQKKLDQKLVHLQKESKRENRMLLCEDISRWLVEEGWLIPLSHERASVFASTHVSGLGIISEGFIPFNELWLK